MPRREVLVLLDDELVERLDGWPSDPKSPGPSYFDERRWLPCEPTRWRKLTGD